MYQFTVKAFNDLTVVELYAILQLRESIFVVEQNCVYHDIDGMDGDCFHVFATEFDTQEIIAYARLVPARIKFDVPSIGRVITHKKHRGNGLGKALMVKAIDEIHQKFNSNNIKISAQTYLHRFYSGLGFTAISDAYDEDGIEHVDMILNLD